MGGGGSKNYWEQRYKKNGTSGSGSYGRLAEFKAEIVNEFIRNNNINSCIEWGCGDGNQLSLMNYKKYLGLDVSKEIINKDIEKFKNDCTKKFMIINENMDINNKYDMSISLDVIFHLVEDSVFENYMNNLFKYASKFVCIYSSNENTEQCGYYNHMKHRKFTDYIDMNFKNWRLCKYIKNKYPYDENNSSQTSFCDFYFYKKVSFINRIKDLFKN